MAETNEQENKMPESNEVNNENKETTKGIKFWWKYLCVRRRITIGCNSKLKSRLTPIRPRGLACNCTFLSA